MKKQYLLLGAIFTLLGNISYGQLVGANTFLQGNFLEIGVARNGSFQAGPAPAGYHPNGPGTTLGSVYDWGHDGWATGTPPYYGDYTFPGTPFEGWSMQVNGTRYDAFYTTGASNGTSFTAGLTGTNTAYTNVGGVATGVWQGTCAGLNVTQTTRVESGASWAVVTTEFNNPTGAPINGVYYWRSCDPDNDQTRTTNFNTINTVVYQNDVAHRVMVSSVGTSSTNAYLALATKDCRAKSMIYTSWASFPANNAGNSLDKVWAGTATSLGTTRYALGQMTPPSQDIAIGLIYNIGTINPGQTAVISYAYTYGNDNSIDSAFPEPQLVTNGIPQQPTGPAPAPTIDTFDACNSGLSVLPVNINFANDKNWTNSTWTWAPTTGLANPTGVINSINLAVLPPVITYTITGNDSNINMMNCNYRVMYLTVKTCNGAVANSPCYGDTLKFNAPGDSTAATYAWYGPAPSTTVINTNQAFFKFPATWADTGTYSVIKTVAGMPDTATVTVVIHPKPVATASSNSPLCIGALDTLTLAANSTVTPVTYSWSGPAGFTSGLQNPTRPGLAQADTGLYTVVVTSIFGCKDTGTTFVRMLPPPGPPSVTGTLKYCEGETFVPFTVTAPGTVYWYPTANPVGGSLVTPSVNTAVAGTYTNYFNQVIGRCISAVDSITVVVKPKSVAAFTPDVILGCFNDVLVINNTSVNAATYTWDFGDGTTGTGPTPTHAYASNTTVPNYIITLNVKSVDDCPSMANAMVDTRHEVHAEFTASPDTFCAVRGGLTSTSMTNTSWAKVTGSSIAQPDMTYAWDFGDGTTDAGVTPATNDPKPYPNPGVYKITLIVTDTIGCKDTTERIVTALRVDITSFGDSSICLRQPMRLDNEITITPPLGYVPAWTYSWVESPVPNLSDPTIRNPYLNGYGTFNDELTATILPWGCYDVNMVTVHSVLGQMLTNVTPDATIPYGSTLQLNSENEMYYTWIPNDGSINNPNINNPVVAPIRTTTYTVYGMDKYGCVDSAFVTVTVDSTLNESIPSAFTPNGDGLNDIFRPIGLKYQRLVEFRVYNRWGQQIYYTRDAKQGWDGTHDGVPQDLGVYHYQVIVAHPDGNNVMYKGDVTLIR